MTERRALLLSTVVALGLVGVLERWSAASVEDWAELETKIPRPANVVVLPKNPANVPPPKTGRTVLLVGNSHTYALPSLERGKPLRPDPGGTLIDTLADEVDAKQTTFYRLSYPNFLPFEMLTRVAHLFHRGYRADIVVLGLTWRNVARDSDLRDQIRRAFGDREFVEAFKAMVDPTYTELTSRIDLEQQQILRELEEERGKSDADRLESRLAAAVGEHLTLLRKSNALRTGLYLTLNNAVTNHISRKRKQAFDYDVVASDLAFNLVALDVLLDVLAKHGAHVILYQAPERTDLPPLMDPEAQAQVITSIADKAKALGFVALDARPIVRNELWGYAYDTPDRSHFTEEGHRALARFLVQSAPETWSAVRVP